MIRFRFALLFSISFSILFAHSTAQAKWWWDPDDYYVAKTDIVGHAVTGMFNQRSEVITFKAGQIIDFEKDLRGNYYTTIKRRENGKWVSGRVTLTPTEVESAFTRSEGIKGFSPTPGSPLFLTKKVSALADSAEGLASNASPEEIGKNKEPFDANTGVELMESHAMNFGTDQYPDWQLAQNVCVHTGVFSFKKCGWVRGDSLRRASQTQAATGSMARPAIPWKKPECLPDGGLKAVFAPTAEIASILAHVPVAEQGARDELMGSIGKCVVQPPNLPAAKLRIEKFNAPLERVPRKPGPKGEKLADRVKRLMKEKPVFTRGPGTNMYDAYAHDTVAAQFKKDAKRLAGLQIRSGGQSRPMTKEDYITIDTFARTLYREMGKESCVEKGGYMEAVARTIINRAENPNSKNFQRPPAKSPQALSRAILSDQAYSLWNNANEVSPRTLAGHKENLLKALCPVPARNQAELKSWSAAVEIATHAVLDHDAFMKDTESLGGILYYTSRIEQSDNYTEIKPDPRYHGESLSDNSCMRFGTPTNESFKNTQGLIVSYIARIAGGLMHNA